MKPHEQQQSPARALRHFSKFFFTVFVMIMNWVRLFWSDGFDRSLGDRQLVR